MGERHPYHPDFETALSAVGGKLNTREKVIRYQRELILEIEKYKRQGDFHDAKDVASANSILKTMADSLLKNFDDPYKKVVEEIEEKVKGLVEKNKELKDKNDALMLKNFRLQEENRGFKEAKGEKTRTHLKAVPGGRGKERGGARG